MSNLENVKPGDELLLSGFGYKGEIVTVTRVTERYIIVGSRKFNRNNGDQSPREKWGTHVSILSDETRAVLMAKMQAAYLQGFEWSRLSPDALNELAEWMHAHGFDTMPIASKQESEK